jgi:holliday junction DNA helicase RuvA
MIGYLKGSVTYKNPAFIYIECGGVAYHVNISLNTYSKLDQASAPVTVFTHQQVREDDISLWGFMDEEERQCFVHLISVSGVGCNTARVILSYMSTEELKKAIIHEDEFTLSKVKGIGPKTAKRLILDLKDKFLKQSGGEAPHIAKVAVNGIKEEALAALIALGFPKNVVEKQLSSVISKQPSIENVEDLIKSVLKQMS